MKLFYKKKIKIRLFQAMLTSFLISLSLTGTDCEKALTGGSGSVPQEMLGNWKLVEQTGALIDICADETINFQSTGVAILTCPNSNPISRDFTVQNSVLTYTETSVAYSIQTLTNDSLYLIGQNVSRNLRYLKIIADDAVLKSDIPANLNNSSEAKR